MNLSQLQTLLKVVSTGSVSRAAAQLFLSQPAVTKQIRSLEEELKVKLFERSGRRIVPTPAVRLVLPRIEHLLHELEQIRGELTNTEAGVSGVVHFGSGPILARSVMPDVIALCRKQHPKMQVVLFEAALVEQATRLRSGELRIGFGTDHLEDPDLTFVPLLSDELVLITPLDHRLAKGRRPVSLEQIRRESVIMHLYARMVEKALRRAGQAPRKLVEEKLIYTQTSNTETIAAFVARGLGVSLVPNYVVKLLKPPGIAIRPVQEKLRIEVGYYHLRSVTLNPMEKVLIETVRTILCGHLAERNS